MPVAADTTESPPQPIDLDSRCRPPQTTRTLVDRPSSSGPWWDWRRWCGPRRRRPLRRRGPRLRL